MISSRRIQDELDELIGGFMDPVSETGTLCVPMIIGGAGGLLGALLGDAPGMIVGLIVGGIVGSIVYRQIGGQL